MDVVQLSRWQFAITTVYHFFFVPLTIGLSGLVAGLQTAWLITNNERYLKLTKFFGKLFLINFAMGIVTGIVQEFQFGMSWSDYSRFVGDVFGAPLALEGLLAFFLESTFLGLWIFGWDRLPKLVHLACIWIASIGTVISAYFILVANSWMQNPVGFTYNAARGRAELTDFWAVLTNPVATITLPHQILACYLVAGAFLAAVAGWHMWRNGRKADADPHLDDQTWRKALRIGAVTMVLAGLGVALTGDLQGKVMYQVQPMKMAAAEALFESAQPAPFSVITIGTPDGKSELLTIKVPYVLSWLASGDFNARVRGINELQAEYQRRFGAGDYAPNTISTYWTFRAMMGLGLVSIAVGMAMLWFTRKQRIPRGQWWRYLMIITPLLPLLANSFGWIFTETGRQPWLVFGLLRTADGVSPGVTATDVIISLSVFTLLYGTLAVIETRLLATYIRKGLPEVTPPPKTATDEDAPLSFAY